MLLKDKLKIMEEKFYELERKYSKVNPGSNKRHGDV